MSKYGNRITEYRGEKYHSKKEALYAQNLDIFKRAKDPKQRVAAWVRQVPYDLHVNGTKIGRYIADFVVTFTDGHEEVVDVKGFKTDIYKWKKKHFEAEYGLKLWEV